MQNKKMNVEVCTERVHKTRRCWKSVTASQTSNPYTYKSSKYKVVDTLIKGDRQPGGSEGHLSNMDHAKLHTMTETHIRTVAVTQAERILRDQVRTANKRNNAQTNTQVEDNSTNANKWHKPDNGTYNHNKQGGHTQKKKGAREECACPYCLAMPSPHRFSECPNKKANQAKKAEEQAKKDVKIARLSITSGNVEDITEGDEH
ncbi:hypothetical protein SARC_00971 [Sphaeroforma arctica JP610]|uniref:Uncharacterized protein n=1 Tax=Sphaeroforma arctica JP610 TaxID=667725 RepID=A0A0L0GDB3_9EUKA|nr:hypothetical protein SARC_00971 [Sphaeroforma arctica JP610]KNC86876.1 hypothetical protein SARC_00971 [Sphaeroforma arctica JP610]|eukprot:XP_014160778.1 hypothetical protein SARC_00971 [Sphaeroforma arctica JP610]